MSQEQLARLAEGIKRAHEAGNVEHVKVLGAEYRRLEAELAGGGATPSAPKDTSLSSAFLQGIDQPLEAMSETADVLGFDGTAGVLKKLTPGVGPTYENATKKFLNEGGESYDWGYLPRAVVEQSGQFAGSILSRAGGAAVGGLAGGAVGSIVPGVGSAAGGAAGAVAGGFAGPALFEAAQIVGPVAKERAKNNGRTKPNAEDIEYAFATAAASGALNAIAPGAQGALKRMMLEGVTEGAQSVVQQTGETAGTNKGWQVDPKQAVGEGILGVGSAGAVDATVAAGGAVKDTAKAAGSAVTNAADAALGKLTNRTDEGNYTEDDVRLAKELVEYAGSKEALANVDDTNATTNRHQEVESSAQGYAKGLLEEKRHRAKTYAARLKKYAKEQGLDADHLDRIETILTTQPGSGSHLKSALSDNRIAEIERAFPNVDETRKLVSELRQMQRLVGFTQPLGDIGGLGVFTRKWDITDPRNGGMAGMALAGAGGFAGGFIGAAGAAGSGMAMNRVARMIDKRTNRRSKIKRFVDSVEAHGPKRGGNPIGTDPNGGPSPLDQIVKQRRFERTADGALRRIQGGDNGIVSARDALASGNWQKNPQGLAAERKAEADAREDAAFNAAHLAGKVKAAPNPQAQAQAQATPNSRVEAAQAQQAMQVQEAARQQDLEAQARKQMWESGEIPRNPETGEVHEAYKGYDLWAHYTGLKNPNDIADALEAMEGVVPGVDPGTASRFVGDIASFDPKEASRLQDIIRQRFNGDYVPKNYKKMVKEQSVVANKALAALSASSIKPEGNRKKFKAKQGERLTAKLADTIESHKDALDANTYLALQMLRNEIDVAAKTRDDRVARVKEVLRDLFGTSPLYNFWLKEFSDLAAIGNDYRIEREVEAEAKAQAEFDQKIEKAEAIAKKKRKSKQDSGHKVKEEPDPSVVKKTDPAPDTVEPSPLVNTKGEPEQQTKQADSEYQTEPSATKADKALSKLKKKSKAKDPNQIEFDFDAPLAPAAQEVEAEAPIHPAIVPPKKRKKEGKNSLKDTFDHYVEKLQAYVDREITDGEDYQYLRESLGDDPAGQVTAIILDNASSNLTVNKVIDVFAAKNDLSAAEAAQIVMPQINHLAQLGAVKPQMKKGHSKLKSDGSLVRDEEGGLLDVVTLTVPMEGNSFYEVYETAKAINHLDKAVSQQGPEFQWEPNMLRNGRDRAFKDGEPLLADPNNVQPLQDALDFQNALRNQTLTLHPKILDQMDAAMADRDRSITDILRPATKDGKDSNHVIDTLGQIAFQLGRNDGQKDYTGFNQEWVFGRNMRIYSKNGYAHSQAGDLMKGLIRMPKKQKIGSEEGFKLMLLSMGNIIGYSKDAPAKRRQAVMSGGNASALYDFAKNPSGREALESRKHGPRQIKSMIKHEGYFQTLNVAHEIKDMVDFAKKRNPKLAKLTPEEVLAHPDAQKDWIENYETDYIVQLDASNNAYQIAGMLTGNTDLLKSTGLIPQNPDADPDEVPGGDIYMAPAKAVQAVIPELAVLPDATLRDVFKNPIGTYLYAATFNSRSKAFEKKLAKAAGGAPIYAVKEGEGLFTIPTEMLSGLKTEAGYQLASGKTVRIVERDGGVALETKQKDGSFKAGRIRPETADELAADIATSDLIGRMNSALIKDFEARFPGVKEYLGFANSVATLVKKRAEAALDTQGIADPRERERFIKENTQIAVPTPDGLVLKYAFKDVEAFEGVEAQVGDYSVTLGLQSREPNEKVRGRGLAAFMTHQIDSYLLRETHKRMRQNGGIDGFNPIHDSYGFSARDAARGQKTFLEAFQELGSNDYNLFEQILKANGISPEDFAKAGGKMPTRKGVTPLPAHRIPTALS